MRGCKAARTLNWLRRKWQRHCIGSMALQGLVMLWSRRLALGLVGVSKTQSLELNPAKNVHSLSQASQTNVLCTTERSASTPVSSCWAQKISSSISSQRGQVAVKSVTPGWLDTGKSLQHGISRSGGCGRDRDAVQNTAPVSGMDLFHISCTQ